MEKIKVLAICASPRLGKNTDQLLQQSLLGCESADAEIEFFSVSGKNMTPCAGCSACKIVGRCPIQDDVTVLLQKLNQADVVLFGSPVFFYDVTAQCKIIIDRSYAVQPLKSNKIGGILLTAGSMGGSSALNTLNMFFTAHGITSSGYVLSLGKANQNKKALESAFDLGVKAVHMAEVLKAASQNFSLHNHYAYGTHTK